jgi:hypothetical protein
MPKRKRSGHDYGNSNTREQRVQETLAQSRKLLHRALKTAKGFERQKLGKRLKLAIGNNQTSEVARTNREIEALKGLDLTKLTEAHLYKTLLKVKAFAGSDLLPDEVRKEAPKLEGAEETLAAIHNVTSGMYNTKPVKDVMQQSVAGMYVAMGIPVPTNAKTKAPKSEVVKVPSASSKDDRIDMISEPDTNAGSEEESWNGLDSDHDGEEDEDNSGASSLDEEELSRYDALLGASSDEESFDEAEYKAKRPAQPRTSSPLSLSPTPSRSPSLERLQSPSSSPSPEPQARPAKIAKSKPAPAKSGSTFLPTLMGGYWSGSESAASDLEDSAPAARKNRRGQAARRAIAEKKYGEKAKHIQAGKGPAGKANGKDDGWDAKRGAKGSNDRPGKSRGFGSRDALQRGRNFERATGENAVTVTPKPRGMGKKDDVGVLHPSWQAAKKAKEAKKAATFQGKVTFD